MAMHKYLGDDPMSRMILGAVEGFAEQVTGLEDCPNGVNDIQAQQIGFMPRSPLSPVTSLF